VQCLARTGFLPLATCLRWAPGSGERTTISEAASAEVTLLQHQLIRESNRRPKQMYLALSLDHILMASESVLLFAIVFYLGGRLVESNTHSPRNRNIIGFPGCAETLPAVFTAVTEMEPKKSRRRSGLAAGCMPEERGAGKEVIEGRASERVGDNDGDGVDVDDEAETKGWEEIARREDSEHHRTRKNRETTANMNQ
jgi:hypothetical protein